jgi:nitrogen fixation/metabolism regulation signal transduction histidine kinase
MTNDERQTILDEEHLRLLRIGYFVAGATHLFFALIPLIYVAIGIGIATAGISPSRPGEPRPAMIGVLMIVVGMLASFLLGAVAVLQLIAARALGQRRSRLLCQIAAGASCLQMPWGVVLAVFTFIVLGRESVKQLFEPAPSRLMPAPARVATSLFDNDEVNTAETAELRS